DQPERAEELGTELARVHRQPPVSRRPLRGASEVRTLYPGSVRQAEAPPECAIAQRTLRGERQCQRSSAPIPSLGPAADGTMRTHAPVARVARTAASTRRAWKGRSTPRAASSSRLMAMWTGSG